MHASTLAFALLAGAAMAVYSIFMKLGSSGIHPAFGAAVITGVAFLVNASVVVFVWTAGTPIPVSATSVGLLVVVGVAAASADLFTLSAYGRGLPVTSSFIIGGSSVALVLLVGFLLLKEPFSWTKLLAVGLIAAGVFLLQRQGV
jgi:drug/metabolite transporter (DMT)-like permease